VLAEGTAEVRGQVARSPFLSTLFRGDWGEGVLGEYARGAQCVAYLRCLRDVYSALEGALWRHRAHPVVGALLGPEVWRVGAIDADLCCLSGLTWRRLPQTSSAVALHTGRLRVLAEEAPCLLVAHAYAGAVCESQAGGLPEAWAVRTFCPPAAAALRPCPRAAARPPGCPAATLGWEERLDALPLTPAETAEVVQEARLAFRLRDRLCAELSRRSLGLSPPSA
jgi:heme oxygenase